MASAHGSGQSRIPFELKELIKREDDLQDPACRSSSLLLSSVSAGCPKQSFKTVIGTPRKSRALRTIIAYDYTENRDSKLLLPMDESDQAAAVTAVMYYLLTIQRLVPYLPPLYRI